MPMKRHVAQISWLWIRRAAGDQKTPPAPAPPNLPKGASIYDVRSGWWGWGSTKSRQREYNQLISVHDKGGEGEKIRIFCGRNIWKPQNAPHSTIIPRALLRASDPENPAMLMLATTKRERGKREMGNGQEVGN